VRIVYIASLLTYDGVEHIGQSLTRHFQTEHDICVVGAIAAAHSELHSTRVSDRVMPVEDLDGVDIVYMEGGWTDGSGGVTERFPLDLAETFVRGGGQLIVADVDRNSARRRALGDDQRVWTWPRRSHRRLGVGRHKPRRLPRQCAMDFEHDDLAERSNPRIATVVSSIPDAQPGQCVGSPSTTSGARI